MSEGMWFLGTVDGKDCYWAIPGQFERPGIHFIGEDGWLVHLPLRRSWRCFFCDEVFTTVGAARDHFGADQLKTAGCQIKEERGLLMKIRDLEKQIEQYHLEETPVYRQLDEVRAQNIVDVRRAEEQGYAQAMKDIEEGKVEPEYRRRLSNVYG